jgi:Family of unknown function (DUF6122)
MLQPLIHYGIHLIVPLIIAYLFYKAKWKLTFVIMLSTMLIDLDHLLATPIFDPNRCSINFHPLHSYIAIGIYIVLLLPKKTRLLGLGLCIHILADWVDCVLM